MNMCLATTHMASGMNECHDLTDLADWAHKTCCPVVGPHPARVKGATVRCSSVSHCDGTFPCCEPENQEPRKPSIAVECCYTRQYPATGCGRIARQCGWTTQQTSTRTHTDCITLVQKVQDPVVNQVTNTEPHMSAGPHTLTRTAAHSPQCR